jgi:hypothetical protein
MVGRPMWANTSRRTPAARAAPATAGTLRWPPTPPANRIGRSQAAASANINSTPCAQPGNSQNSGAHTTVPSGTRMR